MKVDVRVIQLEMTRQESGESRMQRVEQLLKAQKGADLILLPEMWKCGFHSAENYYSYAEDTDGPTVQMLSAMAAELGAYIFGGSIITNEGDTYYNTSLMFDRKGRLIATYNKMHLFGFESIESRLLTAGEEVVCVDTDFGRVGLSTCYDMRFPEQYRRMVEMGAKILLVAADWPERRLEHWKLFNRTRALENQSFLISCNTASAEDRSHPKPHAGHSMIVGPEGEVLAEAGDREEVLQYIIDTNDVRKYRSSFPALADRVKIE